jgi:intein/homing endonuclease
MTEEEQQLTDINEPPNDSWGTQPDEDVYGVIDDATKQRIVEMLYEKFDFREIEENYLSIEEKLRNNEIPENWTYILDKFLLREYASDFTEAMNYFPRLRYIMQLYVIVKRDYLIDNKDKIEKDLKDKHDKMLEEFFGNGFELAREYLTTGDRVSKYYKTLEKWEDTPPESVFPWEMRIGLTRLLVPPININVNTSYRVSSLSGGAIRQPNSPKFNAGHSETSIELTLYFPTHESIWGVNTETGNLEIDTDNPEHAGQIQKLASSLRGLVAQFKFAPFLPIRNAYLNQTYGVTGVTMESMSIATVENYPFCLMVKLNLLKFNHNIYLPMVRDFHQAIHWGRYRHYVGRALAQMEKVANEKFLEETFGQKDPEDPESWADPQWGWNVEKEQYFQQSNKINITSPRADFLTARKNGTKWLGGNAIDFYYPLRTVNKIFAPDTSFFRQPGEDWSYERDEAAWNLFANGLGIVLDENPSAQYAAVVNRSAEITSSPSEREVLLKYLQGMSLEPSEMGGEELDKFIQSQIEIFTHNWQVKNSQQDPPQEAIDDLVLHIKGIWFSYIYTGYKETPWFKAYIESAEFKNGKFWFDEWAVPMAKMSLNPNNVIINGVSVTLANNISRQQVQMQDEPAHQHLGGRDSMLNISLTIVGEEDLIQIRRMFKHIQGLARLEAAHGVLGFLGVKNYITALAGMKYILPLDMQVSTIPGYPHHYTVTLSFVDFDVLQQKREQLSSDQQKELINSFGKRNPFFRIKQQWSNFNAYPDLPLTIRDGGGGMMGTMSPDYYFRAYSTVSEDIYNWNLIERTNANIAKLGRDVAKHLKPKLDSDGNTEPDKDSDVPLTDSPQEEDIAINYPTGYDVNYKPPAVAASNKDPVYSPTLRTYFGAFSESQDEIFFMDNQAGEQQFGSQKIGNVGAQFPEGDGSIKHVLLDTTGSDVQGAPSIPGLTPLSETQRPYADKTNDPTKQFELMMRDTAYREIDGRMIKAFPTYMLWLIDEGGRFAGVKLFDNFYGLQSVIDFSVVRSEDIMADTLVLRLSNVYGKLSLDIADYQNYDNPDDILNNNDETTTADRDRNLRTRGGQIDLNQKSGMVDSYVVELQNIRLKPGVRVHLRAGYSADPNSLDTLFNGVITEVQQGEIVTVVAQSDAVELSSYINSTDTKGHSGTIDGALSTGFWLSEPRDLMVRLLSMGSSRMREAFSAALDGLIYSESKFGIRHFGMMLYAPLSEAEQERENLRRLQLRRLYDAFVSNETESAGDVVGLGVAAVLPEDPSLFGARPGAEISERSPMMNLLHSMAQNFMLQRDFEIFKRNIYPGNGTGVAQFLGGDLTDAGTMALAATATLGQDEVNPGARYPVTSIIAGTIDPTTEAIAIQDAANDAGAGAPLGEVATDETEEDTETEVSGPLQVVSAISLGAATGLFRFFHNPTTGGLGLDGNPVANLLGLGSLTEDDLQGFDEVSFRAQTYMKSIWDLFQVCAALLPNYVVAVRPFEDRSTVFYGKPHWLYTSGLIPITTGIPKGSEPNYEQHDQAMNDWLIEASNEINPQSDLQAEIDFYKGLTVGIDPSNPVTTTQGMQFTGGLEGAANLPTIHANGAVIPTKQGRVALEMHLPTTHDTASGGLRENRSQWSADKHLQLPDLPEEYKFPAYCNLPGSGSNGFGAFGPLTPEDEQYYMTMRWPYAVWPGDPAPKNPDVQHGMYRGLRILAYCIRTGKAVVCTPAESGPAYKTGRIGGLSPDAMHVVGAVTDDEFIFGFVPDGSPLGPVSEAQVAANVQANNEAVDAITTVAVGIQTQLAGTNEFERPKWLLNDDDPWWAVEDINYLSQWNVDPYRFAYEHGWRELPDDNNQIPVHIEADANLPFPDEAGTRARRMWDEDFNNSFEDEEVNNWAAAFVTNDGLQRKWRNKEQASAIWYQFRKKFPDSEKVREAWDQVQLDPQGDFDDSNNNDPGVEGKPESWVKARYDKQRWDNLTEQEKQQTATFQFERQIEAFMSLMWKHPYARAWIVLSMNRRLDRNVILDSDDIGIPGDFDLLEIDDIIYGPAFPAGKTLELAWDKMYRLSGFSRDEGDKGWDMYGSPVFAAWLYFIMPHPHGFTNKDQLIRQIRTSLAVDTGQYDAVEEFILWMKTIYVPGSDADTLAHAGQDGVQRTWDKTIGKLLTGVSQSLSGLINMFRMSLQQLGHGLDMVGTMQRQANILNGLLNDSVYYSAGEPGSLPRLADNPFTREYGEPVVEIREPFQRMHFLSSFQHIIGNNVNETTNDVATVITASSDGKYPVTVHLDKGASPERQVERAVDTGIFWDNAKGSGWSSRLHPLINPIETMRGYIKQATGSSDELLSKRIALWHLKESIKDIYTGEVIIIGDPSIRPFDLVYLADVYERMYGMFEVEQVVHHFTPTEGFYTSITPNALVTINDPARWSMIGYAWAMWSQHNIRSDVRNLLHIKADGSASMDWGLSKDTFAQEMAAALEPQMRGHVQYTQGNSAIVKDIAANFSGGMVPTVGHNIEMAHLLSNLLPTPPGVELLAGWAWDGWKWVRDNLLDQHGCFPAGAKVLTENGYRNIEDITNDDMVFTHEGRFQPVIETMVRDIDEDIYELSLDRMTAIKLTPTKEHPFLVFRENQVKNYGSTFKSQNEIDELEPEWIEAKDLSVGDYVVIQPAKREIETDTHQITIDMKQYLPNENSYIISKDYIQAKNSNTKKLNRHIPLNVDVAYVIGRYLGDGHLEFENGIPRLIGFTFNKKEVESIQYISSIFREIFGLEANNTEQSTKTDAYYLKFGSSAVAEWIRNHFGHGFSDKVIPEWVFDLPRELKVAILAGLYGSDGCVINDASGVRFKLDLTNKGLIMGAFRLLRDLGAYPTINGGGVQVTNYGTGSSNHYSATVYSVDCPELSEAMGYTVGRDLQRRKKKGFIQTKKYTAYRIKSINKIPFRGKVYNFSVKEDESYIVDGIVSHNCYIQYMTKDGQPMDAGLSYNQGVAVGRHHSIDLLPNILGIPLRVDTVVDGHRRITLNDVLAGMGWSEIAIESLHKDASWWANQTTNKVLETAGMGPDPVDIKKVRVKYVVISKIIDADTIVGSDGARYRLTPLDAPELSFKNNLDLNPQFDPGRLSTEWVINTLNAETVDIGHPWTFAIRINESRDTDDYGRTLGVIFHRCPQGTTPEDREATLMNYASQVPVVPWDSFMEDGRPYTLNWEMLMRGYASIYAKSLQLGNPDEN